MAKWLDAMGQKKYEGLTRQSGGRLKWNGKVRLDEASLNVPRSWSKGRMIFVSSMSDLFHEDVPIHFIERVFQVMRECRHHTFQVLTKRSERLKELSTALHWAPNIWLSIGIEY